MAKAKIPTSMQEACEILCAQLSVEDIDLIKSGQITPTDMHFFLGLWIRNNWIYKGKLQPSQLGLDDTLGLFPDSISDEILTNLVSFIKENK